MFVQRYIGILANTYSCDKQIRSLSTMRSYLKAKNSNVRIWVGFLKADQQKTNLSLKNRFILRAIDLS